MNTNSTVRIPGEAKKLAPPYIAHRTFLNFLERLKAQGIPTRIDRSVVPSLSGGMQVHLFTTLKYLRLMSPNGIPTETLRKLVSSEGEERQAKFKDILVASYPFLFKDEVNLKGITAQELRELFGKEGLSGGTIPKAINFFIEIAKDSGIELSPYIGKIRASGPRIPSIRVKKKNGEKQGASSHHEESLPKTEETSWQQLALSKFPDFDPSWAPEVQEKWFEGMNKLMDEFKK